MSSRRLDQKFVTKHYIQLSNEKATSLFHLYFDWSHQRQLERDEVSEMLQGCAVKPATTEWALLIVFLEKSDGSLQFIYDYQKLNAITACES